MTGSHTVRWKAKIMKLAKSSRLRTQTVTLLIQIVHLNEGTQMDIGTLKMRGTMDKMAVLVTQGASIRVEEAVGAEVEVEGDEFREVSSNP